MPRYLALLAASIGLSAYLTRPSAVPVLAVFGLILVAVRVVVVGIFIHSPETSMSSARERSSEWSLLALMLPIISVFLVAGYSTYSALWPASLGIGLTDLSYVLFVATAVGHFNVLGLHDRLSTISIALTLFAIGLVLANFAAPSFVIPEPALPIRLMVRDLMG